MKCHKISSSAQHNILLLIISGIVISIDAGTAAFNLADGIFVGPEQSWFCRLPNTTVADIHAISSDIVDAGDASANVIVAALIDDVG